MNAEYEIQIDLGLRGQCYQRFETFEGAIAYAREWGKSFKNAEGGTVRVQVGLASFDGWSFDDDVSVNKEES